MSRHFVMDAIVVKSNEANVLPCGKVLYLHCVDVAAKIVISSAELPFIQFGTLLGHISFLEKLGERRLILIANSESLKALVRQSQSPVVIEVKSSSGKISKFTFTFSVFTKCEFPSGFWRPTGNSLVV